MMNDWIDGFPSDRFDVCPERSRKGERCEREADHGGAHSFQLDCAECELARDEDEQHGKPLFPKPVECLTCRGIR